MSHDIFPNANNQEDNSKETNHFSESKEQVFSQKKLENSENANAYLIKLKNFDFEDTYESIQEDLKERCRAKWVKGKNGKWVGLAFLVDKIDDFYQCIDGYDLPRDAFELVPHQLDAPKMKPVRMEMKAEQQKGKIRERENKKTEENEEIDRKWANGELTDEEYHNSVEMLSKRFSDIPERKVRQLRTEEAALKLRIDEVKKSQKEADFNPFTLEELQQAIADEHVGDAFLFNKLSKGDVLFDANENSFYQWNGVLWIRDDGRRRNKLLIQVAEKFANVAGFAKGEADRLAESDTELADSFSKMEKAFRKRALLLKTVQRQSSALDMARVGFYGEGGLTFSGIWDSSIECIPCANGLLDIRTRKLMTPEKKHFIRKASGVKYNPDASGEEFYSFVTQIMNGMEERANFLRRFFGYAVFGRPVEDRLLFLWGEHGRNGKGTLMRCICSVLGSLAKTFSPELILLQRNPPSSSTPRPDLVHLQGVRIAIFSEINKGRQIDAAILKNLTGRDIIAARSLHSNDIKNFSPSHTLILQANHKPKSPSEDEALWRRFILVPFDLTFIDNPDPNKPHERLIDRSLEERLLKNPSGILRWLLDGAADYLQQGLGIPEEIAAATQAYRAENDGIGSFIREHCVLDTALSVKRSKITKAIQAHCFANKFDRPTRNEICDYLRACGFKEDHDETGGWWRGLSISRESMDDETS